MNSWLLLVLSLPTENAAVRQRTWRALKACGAAPLRDGVYLMPASGDSGATFAGLASEVRSGGGSALVMSVGEPEGAEFRRHFDRSADYAALIADVARARSALGAGDLDDATRAARKLHKTFAALRAIDFFPGEARRQTEAALDDLDQAIARLSSPDEPHDAAGAIALRDPMDYRGRVWATRRRPWVDRLACAWLIRRFLDPKARILWLERIEDCPEGALGFDFDGATFSHVGGRVTFEAMLASFALAQRGLAQIGAIVHFLDVGGVAPAEASGVERVLAGLRGALDDDRLLDRASAVFDGLLAAFAAEEAHA